MIASVGAFVVASPGHADPVGDLDSGLTCHQEPVVGVRSVLPDGPASAVVGKLYLFDAGGYVVTQVVAPDGWSPLTATDAELAAFGVEPRPSDPVAFAGWQATYAWTGSAAPGLCRLDVTNFVSTTNWAGVQREA